jgi:membrane protease subunit HflC
MSNRILADAFGRDTEFFGFIRSLQAYETSLRGTNSSIVMQPDSEFFSYLRGAGVDGIATAPAEPAPADLEAAVDPAAATASP